MIGLAGASIWLASVGAVFLLLSLTFVGTALAWSAFVVTAVVLGVLVMIDGMVIHRVRKAFVPLPPRTPAHKRMIRRFTYVVAGEVAAFWIADSILPAINRWDLMIPVNVLIVGVHFLPLAWVFRVPRYYALGIAFCAAVVATMWFVPANARIGPVPAWFVWISFGSGPASILCGIANTIEARRLLEKEQAAV